MGKVQSIMKGISIAIGILAGSALLCILGFLAFYFSIALPGIDAAYSPAWSPDGEHIAFECIFYTFPELATGLADDWVRVNYYDRDICIASGLDGKDRLRLTQTHNMRYPSWSTDGNSLAWVEIDRIIAVYDLETEEITRYRSDEPLRETCFYAIGFECELIWSLDGKSIIVQGDGRILDLLTGDFIDLPVSDYSDRVWSSDRRFLAFTKLQNVELQGPYNFPMYLSEGDRTVALTEMNVTSDERFSWSPDNRILVWVGTLDTRYADYDHIAFSNGETGETSIPNLPDDIRDIDNPVWSPDGTRIAFGSLGNICVLELGILFSPFSVTIEKVTIFPTSNIDFAATVAWSNDNQHLAYQTSDGKLRVVDINGEHDRRIQ